MPSAPPAVKRLVTADRFSRRTVGRRSFSSIGLGGLAETKGPLCEDWSAHPGAEHSHAQVGRCMVVLLDDARTGPHGPDSKARLRREDLRGERGSSDGVARRCRPRLVATQVPYPSGSPRTGHPGPRFSHGVRGDRVPAIGKKPCVTNRSANTPSGPVARLQSCGSTARGSCCSTGRADLSGAQPMAARMICSAIRRAR